MKDKTYSPYINVYINTANNVTLSYGGYQESADQIDLQLMSISPEDIDFIVDALKQIKKESL